MYCKTLQGSVPKAILALLEKGIWEPPIDV
jgi:hypothetical protein